MAKEKAKRKSAKQNRSIAKGVKNGASETHPTLAQKNAPEA